MSSPDTQTQSELQTQTQKEQLINALIKRALQQEDELISEKIAKELKYMIEENENDEAEEKVTTSEMKEKLKGTIWHVARIFAVLRSGYTPKFRYYTEDYGYSPQEMILEVAGGTNWEGYVEVSTPSGAMVGTLEISFEPVRKKEIYENAIEIYNKWENILEIAFRLAEEVAKEVAKDP